MKKIITLCSYLVFTSILIAQEIDWKTLDLNELEKLTQSDKPIEQAKAKFYLGKKFKSSQFKKLLLSIQNQDMQTQRNSIHEAFENWKGEIEQLDDVCVIGVRV